MVALALMSFVMIAAQEAPDLGSATASARAKVEVQRGDYLLPDQVFIQGNNYRDTFIFTTSDPEERREFYRAAERAALANEYVSVIYSPVSAYLDSDGTEVRYPICMMRYKATVFRSSDRCDLTLPKGELSPIQKIALTRSVELDDKPRDGAPLLDDLIMDETVDDPVRRLAVWTKAEAYDALARTHPALSLAQDQAYADALQMYRLLTQLEPDSPWPLVGIADSLAELGDYEGARDIILAMIAEHPDQELQSVVTLAFYDRLLGEYQSALERIEALQPPEGESPGMRYSYHRAWVLQAMGRHQDAIDQLTIGLESQPDYAWAYMRRGCSQSRLGNLPEALSDYRAAADALGFREDDQRAESVRFNYARMIDIVGQLERDIADGLDAPSSDVCVGWWSNDDDARPRSPLLAELE